MPCEVIPRTVNNTHIAVELEFNEATENRTMLKPRIEEKNTRMLSCCADGKENESRPRQQECWEETLEHLDEMFNPKLSQKKIKCRVFGYRTLPRMFSTLEDFEVIKETETAIDDVCVTSEWYREPRLHPNHHESRRQSTSEVRKTELGEVGWFSSSKSGINRRRSSEGLVLSGRRDFGSIECLNDFRSTLVEQPSERKQSDIGVSRRENNAEEFGLVSNTSRRSSFSAMNTVPEAREPQRFYSLPRRLSLPVQNHRTTEKEKRNSVPVNSSFALDNDAEIQWERLVARARSFQMMTSKEPETMLKQQQTKSGKQQADGFHGKGVDQSLESESDGEDIAKRADGNLVNTTLRGKSQQKTACLEKHVSMDTENTDDTKTIKENPTIALTGNEVSNSGQVDLTVKNIPINYSFDNQHQVDRNSRRYSLATARPLSEVREKISGYSTHGALEYARMLLGKIQTEGKTKTKKERLHDMSKALKMVLEELNRIELPDKELVSLFISLRAKIVNLKGELKAEEKDGQVGSDKDTGGEVKVLSKTLPRARRTSDNVTNQTHFRRFSWC